MQSKIKDFFTRGPGGSYVLLLCAFLFGLWRGPIVGPDTAGYAAGDIMRTPLYPLFLRPFLFLFGDDWTRYTYAFQLILVLFACRVTARTLTDRFFSGVPAGLIVLAILLTPVLGPNGIGNKYYSEALAYACFLFTIHFFIQAVTSRGTRPVVLTFSFLLLALLTRPQMLILGVAPGLLAVYFLLARRPAAASSAAASGTASWPDRRKAFFITAGGLVLTLLLSGFFTRSYNYVKHDRFVSVPFTGINLSTAILYVSTPEDAAVFERGTPEHEFLREVLETIDRGGYGLRHNRPPNFLAFSNHYIANYNRIAWLTAYAIYKKRFTETPPERHLITPNEFIAMDALLVDCAKRLAVRHGPRLIKLYASNILRGLGGYYYAALLLAVFGLALLLLFYNMGVGGREEFLIVLIAITAMNFVNYLLLGVLQMVMTRYTFYTDTLQLVVLLLWLLRLTRSHWKRSEA